MPPKHEAFAEHTIENEKPPGSSGTWKWKCKYCGKTYQSSVTRLLAHLSKQGGQIAPCKGIPQALADSIVHKYSLIRNTSKGGGGGSSSTFVPTDASIPSENECPAASGSASGSASNYQSKRPREFDTIPLRQTHIGYQVREPMYVKSMMKAANQEIARTVITCNLSFNLLKAKQWHKMVQAIARVGPYFPDEWHGITYNEMRTKGIDEERARINDKLKPVRDGWAKYGCSILSDGWSDRKKRGILNILVSCTIGTYFLRAVDTGKKGQRTSGEVIYGHIRQAIIEVCCNL